MKTVALTATLLLLGAVGLRAQAASEPADLQTALGLRIALVGAVREGSEKPEQAIAKLKAQRSPSGLKLDADADFALAAIDLGRRLLAAGKAEAAEQFFAEAEDSLGKVLRRTGDQAARAKAAWLHQRALIRSQYLNKAALAAADFEEAIRLQPDDQHLRRNRDAIADGRPAYQNRKSGEGRK